MTNTNLVYRRAKKNVFTGLIEFEWIKCTAVGEVGRESLRIHITVLNKIITVRRRNVIGYISPNIN